MMDLDAGFAPTGEWECMECGYIEAGSRTPRPKVCPDCGAPAQALEFFPYEDEDEDAATADDDIFEDEDEEQG